MTVGELLKESGAAGVIVLSLAAVSIAAFACGLGWLRRSRLIPASLAGGGELGSLVDAAKTVPGVMAAALVSSGADAQKAKAAVGKAARELLGPPVACAYLILAACVISPMAGVVGASAGMARAFASLGSAETGSLLLADSVMRACSAGALGFAVGAGAFALYAAVAWRLERAREALDEFAEELGRAP